MSLRDTIRAAVAPTVAKVIADFGSIVDVRYADESATNPDGSAKLTWSVLDHDIPAKLDIIEAVEAQRIFGRETRATAKGMIAEGPALATGQALIVTSGFLVDSVFRVESVRLNDLGTFWVLALVESRLDEVAL